MIHFQSIDFISVQYNNDSMQGSVATSHYIAIDFARPHAVSNHTSSIDEERNLIYISNNFKFSEV